LSPIPIPKSKEINPQTIKKKIKIHFNLKMIAHQKRKGRKIKSD